MNKKEILSTIKMLASSQGFYSRLYANIMNLKSNERGKILQLLENKKFNDSVDLIMYLEG